MFEIIVVYNREDPVDTGTCYLCVGLQEITDCFFWRFRNARVCVCVRVCACVCVCVYIDCRTECDFCLCDDSLR